MRKDGRRATTVRRVRGVRRPSHRPMISAPRVRTPSAPRASPGSAAIRQASRPHRSGLIVVPLAVLALVIGGGSAAAKQTTKPAAAAEAELCAKQTDPSALFTLGEAALSRGGSAGGRAAQSCFHRATEVDPRSAWVCAAPASRTHPPATSNVTQAPLSVDDFIGMKGWLGKGRLAEALRKTADAEELYQRALQLSDATSLAEVHERLGSLLMAQQRYAESQPHLQRATDLNRADAGLAYNLGLVAMYQHKYEDSLEAFNEAARRDPTYPDTQINIGAVLFGIGNFDKAALHLQKAIELRPRDENAWRNLGAALALVDLAGYEWFGGVHLQAKAEQWDGAGQALDTYLDIISPRIDPDLAVRAVYCRQQAADWSRWHSDNSLMRGAIKSALASGSRVPTSPFNALSMSAIPADLSLRIGANNAADIADQAKSDVKPGLLPLWLHDKLSKSNPNRERLQIGYVSPDFREHPVGSIMRYMLPLHNASQFKVTCYAINPDSGSQMRSEIAGIVESFVDINLLSDLEAAKRITEDGIDVLVNLGGYTQYMRNGIFALQPAPVQALFIGYATSMAAPFMQYVIADVISAPPSLIQGFPESMAYIPGALLPVSQKHRYPLPPPRAEQSLAQLRGEREKHGLPQTGVVYCSFNALYKADPLVFQSWMNVLAQVPDSVIWLADSPKGALEHLRQEAMAAGVSPARLVAAPWFPEEQHIAIKGLCDLFLDTPAYNAHQTAADALWGGIPMLTLPGEKMVSRVALAMQIALGMPKSGPLAASNYKDDNNYLVPNTRYEDVAVWLGSSRKDMRQLRERTEGLRMSSDLFDLTGRVLALEATLMLMTELHIAACQLGHILLSSPKHHNTLDE